MKILLYNTQWDRPIEESVQECSIQFEITQNRNELELADAVVFHVPTMGDIDSVPKASHQKWVAWSMESQRYYPQLQDREFMKRFDLSMTYRLDSDVPVPYLWQEMVDNLRREPQEKTAEALAVNFISNTHDLSGRHEYIQELMRHIKIDSFGRSLRNKRLPVDRGRGTKLAKIARYKFTLAFENSLTVDYVSEKLFDPLIAGSIPVYLGAPNVDEYAPGENCFINAADFGGPRELAEYLKLLDGDPERYGSYLNWKKRPYNPGFKKLTELLRTGPFCRLCKKVRELRAQESGPVSPRQAAAASSEITIASTVGFNDLAKDFGRSLVAAGRPVRMAGRSGGRPRVAVHFTAPTEVDREAGGRNVNYTMFGAEPIPKLWLEHNATHELVIVPTEYCLDAWVRSGFPNERIRICPPGADSSRFHPDAEPLPMTDQDGKSVLRRRTRILNISDVSARANLMALLRTWIQTTSPEDDAVLILRISGGKTNWQVMFMFEVHQMEQALGKKREDAAPIVFHDSFLSDRQMARLYTTATHYWSMSHGEGWDRAMVRAGAAGLGLIAPNHSAYATFLDDSVARMIPSQEVDADVSKGGAAEEIYRGTRWWEPAEGSAAEHLRQVIESDGESPPRVRERILANFSWERAGCRFTEILDEVIGS